MTSDNKKVDALERLSEEYKVWKIDHPEDFIAEPMKDKNNQENFFTWHCAIPGKSDTLWQGAHYKLIVKFPEDYPYSPPKCQFEPPIFHPNVFPSGTVSLSLIEKDSWKPQTTVKEVLLGIQLLLDDPNFDNPAQAEAYAVYYKSIDEYNARVSRQKEMIMKGQK